MSSSKECFSASEVELEPVPALEQIVRGKEVAFGGVHYYSYQGPAKGVTDVLVEAERKLMHIR